jgi:hypothetical protein
MLLLHSFVSSVMPRLSNTSISILATTPKPRLRQVAVTVLFATLASSSSSSAFSTSWASTSTGTTPASSNTFCLVSRGGALYPSTTHLPLKERRTASFSSSSTTSLSSTTIETAEETASTSMTPASKLEALRAKMKELDLDVYLVPSDDPHLSGTYRIVIERWDGKNVVVSNCVSFVFTSWFSSKNMSRLPTCVVCF